MDYNKEQHLEFIQNNITRMNNCSFQMKGWMITIVSALLAIYASTFENNSRIESGNKVFLLVGVFPTIVFWILDSYYLQQERKFRGVYDDVAEISNEDTRNKIKPYAMPLNYYKGGKYCLLRIMFSRTIWPLYLITIIGLVLAYILLK